MSGLQEINSVSLVRDEPTETCTRVISVWGAHKDKSPPEPEVRATIVTNVRNCPLRCVYM